MAPDTRPPLSHLRPTLSTRLRRSFEGKRSKTGEILSPTSNGSSGLEIDPETLRNAVEQAINGEAFQRAIAANLANIVKPAIKSALDTIQPVVEAVYSHDLLLRKTNKSVERLLENMDTIPEEEDGYGRQVERSGSQGSFYDTEFKALLEKSNKRTIATLAELSNAVQSNTSKIAGLETSVGKSREGMDYLKSFFQNEMDHLQTEVERISQSMESQRQANGSTTSLFSAHANKLDIMASDLAEMKGYSELSEKLESISGELNGLRASVDAGTGTNNGGFVELSTKLDNIVTATQTHATTLDEIKQSNTNPDLLVAIQKSNDSHDSHAVALGEIKERSLAPVAEGGETSSSLEEIKTYLQSHSTALGEIKERSLVPLPVDTSAETTTALEEIKLYLESHSMTLEELKKKALVPAPVETSNTDATTSLQEIKSQLEELKETIQLGHTSSNDNLGGLSSKIDNLLTTLEGHKPTDSSGEILAALQKSNNSHDSHSTALDGMKSLIVVPTPASNNVELSAVETQLSTIINTLEIHTSTLSDLNGREPAPTTDEALNSEVNAISTTLETHTKLLNEIKDNVSAEILTALHDMAQTQASHTTTLSEIREADMSEEILTALHTSNEAHSGHQAEFEKLHGAVRGFDEKYEKHGVDLGEIKSRSLEAPLEVSEASTGDDLQAKIGGIVSILEEQNATLASIKGSTDSALESHTAHTLSLGEIKSRSLEPVPLPVAEGSSIGDLEVKINGIMSILEEQNAELSSIKQSTNSALDLHSAHAVSLNEINARSLETPAVSVPEGSSINDVDAKVAGIISILEEQNTALSTIKESTQLALDSHSSHALSLGEIKSRSLEAPSAAVVDGSFSDLEAKIAAMVQTLEEQKSTLATIHTSTNSSVESHAAHALSLGQIHSRSLEPVAAPEESPILQELDTKITSIVTILEGHSEALATIKDTAHAVESHGSTLDEIKAATTAQRDFHDAHTSALTEIKDASIASRELHDAHSATLADLVISTGAGNESLAELKALPPPAVVDLSGLTALETDLKSVMDILSSHTTYLADIHTSSSTANPELLASIKESHDLLATHTSLLDSIKLSSSTSHEELLTNLTSLKADLKDTKSEVNTHGSLVKDLHSETKDSHSSLTTAISALALGGVAGAGVGFLASKDDEETRSVNPGSEELLNEVKAVRELVEGGVWFNEKGLEQLKSTGFAPIVSVKEIDEGESVKDDGSDKGDDTNVREIESSSESAKESSIVPVGLSIAAAGLALGAGAALMVDDDSEVEKSITPPVVEQESKIIEKSITPPAEETADLDVSPVNEEVKQDIERSSTGIEEEQQPENDSPLGDAIVEHSITERSNSPLQEQDDTPVPVELLDTLEPVLEEQVPEIEPASALGEKSISPIEEDQFLVASEEVEELPVDRAITPSLEDSTLPLVAELDTFELPKVEPTILGDQEEEITSSAVDSAEPVIERSPAPIVEESALSSLPISTDIDLEEKGEELLERSEVAPVVDPETAQDLKTVVGGEHTVDHDLTVLPPIVVESVISEEANPVSESRSLDENELSPDKDILSGQDDSVPMPLEINERIEENTTPDSVPDFPIEDEIVESSHPISIIPDLESSDLVEPDVVEPELAVDREAALDHEELISQEAVESPITEHVTSIHDPIDLAADDLPVADDVASPHQQLHESPLVDDLKIDEVLADTELDSSPVHDLQQSITEEAFAVSDPISSAEHLDRSMPDLVEGSNTVNILSDNEIETTPLQDLEDIQHLDPIEVAEQVEKDVPEIEEITPHVGLAELAGEAPSEESDAPAHSEPLDQGSPTEYLPLVKEDSESHENLTPSAESEFVDFDNPLMEDAHIDNKSIHLSEPARNISPGIEESTTLEPDTSPADDEHVELPQQSSFDPEINNAESPMASPTLNKQTNFEIETPGVESDILDDYLVSKTENPATDEDILDNDTPVKDSSEHAVTRTDELEELTSTEDVVSPSEWMFRSSASKTRDLSRFNNVEAQPELHPEDSVESAVADSTSDQVASPILATLEEAHGNPSQDYFPTQSASSSQIDDELPELGLKKTTSSDSLGDNDIPVVSPPEDETPDIHSANTDDVHIPAVILEEDNDAVLESAPLEDSSVGLPIQGATSAPVLDDEDKPETFPQRSISDDDHSLETNNHEEDNSTPIAAPVLEISSNSHLNELEESLNLAPAPLVEETSHQIATEKDLSPLASPAHTESIYSNKEGMADSTSLPTLPVSSIPQATEEDITNPFASPAEEREINFEEKHTEESRDAESPSADNSSLSHSLPAGEGSITPVHDDSFDFGTDHNGAIKFPAHPPTTDLEGKHSLDDTPEEPSSSPFLSPVNDKTFHLENDYKDDDDEQELPAATEGTIDHLTKPDSTLLVLPIQEEGSGSKLDDNDETSDSTPTPLVAQIGEIDKHEIIPTQEAATDSEIEDQVKFDDFRPRADSREDDDDLVVEWSGKDNEDTAYLPVVIPESALSENDEHGRGQHAPSQEASPILNASAEPISSPTLSSAEQLSPITHSDQQISPIIKPQQILNTDDAAAERPNVFQYLQYESDEETPITSTKALPESDTPETPIKDSALDETESISAILTKGKEVETIPPLSTPTKTVEEELEDWTPVDLDKRYSQTEPDAPVHQEADYFPPPTNGKDVATPTLPEGTDSEPTTPATAGLSGPPSPSALKKAGGKKAKKGKKGKKEKVRFEMDGEAA